MVLSAAVTTTCKVLLPDTRSESPEITTVASTSVGSAITSTSVVPKGRFTTCPLATSSPLTVKTPKVASSFAPTFTVTVYV